MGLSNLPWEWYYPMCSGKDLANVLNRTIQCALGMGLSNVSWMPWKWDYPMCQMGLAPWEWDYPMCTGNGTMCQCALGTSQCTLGRTIQCALGMGLAQMVLDNVLYEWDYPMGMRLANVPWEWD